MKMFLSLIMALFVAAEAPATEQRDGNLWMKMGRQDKMLYLSGVFDGMQTGGELASGVCGHRREIIEAMNKVMGRITTPQVADGLDVFYKDYRNRTIRINDGFDLIVGSITGADPNALESLTRQRRKESTR